MAKRFRASKGRIGSRKIKWALYREDRSNVPELTSWLWSVDIDTADNVTSQGGVIRWDDANGEEGSLNPGQYLVFSKGRFQSLAADDFRSSVTVVASA